MEEVEMLFFFFFLCPDLNIKSYFRAQMIKEKAIMRVRTRKLKKWPDLIWATGNYSA